VYRNNSQQLVDSVNLDLSAETYVLTGLSPTTVYLLDVTISNGVLDSNMEFYVTTAVGRLNQACINGGPPGEIHIS
jgi:hypothetical protein